MERSEQSGEEKVDNKNSKIWVSVNVKLSANYDSVGYSAGKEVTVPTKKTRKGFKKLWAEVEEEIAKQIPEGKKVLANLTKWKE